MTKNHKVSKTKIIVTIMFLVAFIILIVNADKIGSSNDLSYINKVFVGDSKKDVTIQMDTMIISFDEQDELAVVQYIVQAGDTLESIATEFGTTISNLKKINGVSSIKPGMKLVVTNEEDGILYKVRETQNIKVFASKYGLNLEDLMTMNYIQDDTEILYKGQEVFINLSEEKANLIPGFIDKGQPDLSVQVVKPKTSVNNKTTTTSKPSTSTTTNSTTTSSTPSGGAKTSKVISRWTYNKNINNGFYRGYCTRYVATQMSSIFKYTSETTQERPFGGNANQRYANAKKAGFNVGTTPRVGAIIVYSNLRSSAGHVGIVREYHPDKGEMVIEDMNYEGKFVVTKRVESASRSGIIGYIYG
ncbi:MAG: LysM peptidoglycan-binding domain-containing protein [Candidatus Peribacteria bacterium]|jgi:surface antigen|nr:LysM peptidoglycan-binding domain-containing protein [Candidatus Peribacteria bacterium]